MKALTLPRFDEPFCWGYTFYRQAYAYSTPFMTARYGL